MATAPGPRWQRLEHDERRAQILACARRLFSERSYAAVSTSEIASEAGVARGLLHHYFGTKRELYLEVVRTLVRMPSNPVPLQSPGRDLAVDHRGERRALADDARAQPRHLARRDRGCWATAATPRSRRSSTTRASRRPTG